MRCDIGIISEFIGPRVGTISGDNNFKNYLGSLYLNTSESLIGMLYGQEGKSYNPSLNDAGFMNMANALGLTKEKLETISAILGDPYGDELFPLDSNYLILFLTSVFLMADDGKYAFLLLELYVMSQFKKSLRKYFKYKVNRNLLDSAISQMDSKAYVQKIGNFPDIIRLITRTEISRLKEPLSKAEDYVYKDLKTSVRNRLNQIMKGVAEKYYELTAQIKNIEMTKDSLNGSDKTMDKIVVDQSIEMILDMMSASDKLSEEVAIRFKLPQNRAEALQKAMLDKSNRKLMLQATKIVLRESNIDLIRVRSTGMDEGQISEKIDSALKKLVATRIGSNKYKELAHEIIAGVLSQEGKQLSAFSDETRSKLLQTFNYYEGAIIKYLIEYTQAKK